MKNLEFKTVGDVVKKNIKAADVFKKYEIDFCCGGNTLLTTACENNNISYDDLIDELNQLKNKSHFLTNYNTWELDFLIDFIINIHHKFIKENIPTLKQYSDRVAKAHGDNHEELKEINRLIYGVSYDLLDHFKEEETILFPYIKKLVRAKRKHLKVKAPKFVTINNLLEMLEDDHDSAGDVFKKISKLTNRYSLPEDACNTYRALYDKLEEFQDSLFEHIHLENNILFPKAKKLEKRIQIAL